MCYPEPRRIHRSLDRKTRVFLTLSLALLASCCCGQDTPAIAKTAGTDRAPAQPTIVTNAEEVTIDLVAHDKKNKAVLDLKPADLSVTDNGAAVTVSDLRLVSGASYTDHMITLVFDHMEPSGAKSARELAAKILKLVPQKGFSISVVGVQGRLRLFQEFTSDRTAVSKAIASATAAANEKDESSTGDLAALPEKNMVSLAQAGAAPSGTQVSVNQRDVARAMLAALEESQRIIQDQHCLPSLASLLALARTQRQLAGRKVVIFFAQGLQLDSNAKDMIPSIVGTANRSSVSIFTVDANAIDNKEDEGLMTASAAAGMANYNRQNPPPTGPAAQVAVPYGPGMLSQVSDQIGRIESEGLAGYKNPMLSLAGNTGGAYLMATDRLKKTMQQMIDDMTTYYEASYVPPAHEYDGRFRPVAVTPLRKGLKVRSKPGYLALPSSTNAGLRPFEAPLMKILGEAQLPADLKFRSSVLRLGDLPDGNSNALIVEVPLSDLDIREDPNADLFAAHVSIVAQVKNKAGVVIEHFGEDVPRHGALGSIDAARSDVITLQRHFIASPGEYVLEAAVIDRNNGKAGAQRVDFQILPSPSGASLSDVALVRRTDPISADTDLLEPLRYENGRVVPNLSGRVSPEAKSVSLFFMVHPDAQASDQPTLEMEVLRNGQSVGRVPLQLRKSSGVGPIPYLASIRAGSLAAGNYEAIASLTQDGKTNQRSLSFRVDGPELASAASGAMTPTDATKTSSDDSGTPADSTLDSMGGNALATHPLVITTLPESAVPRPSPDELQTLIGDAKTRAVSYATSLPNFICIELTDRSVDASGDGKWRHRDSIAEQLRYHDHAETRTTLNINGKHVTTSRDDMKGAISLGEFGGVLDSVFQAAAKADFQWKEADALGTGTVQVLSYHVSHENSSWALAGDNNWKEYPAFHGLVYVDSATKGVRRITMEADDLPGKFSIHAASITVDYDYIMIGTHDYLMPVRGTIRMREGKKEAVLNEMEFRNYRRYGSTAKILYGGQSVP
jgi:VWFA-related protein